MRRLFADAFYWIALLHAADQWHERVTAPDKEYSLTACMSMHVMRRERLTEVLTNDRHFIQEGFHILFPRTVTRRSSRSVSWRMAFDGRAIMV